MLHQKETKRLRAYPTHQAVQTTGSTADDIFKTSSTSPEPHLIVKAFFFLMQSIDYQSNLIWCILLQKMIDRRVQIIYLYT